MVDNRPGAGGSLGTGIAATSPADGYTLVVGSVAPIVLNPMFYKLKYVSLRDFEPISVIAAAPQLIVVNPSTPAKSVQELVALAKASPNALNYGSSGAGTLPHIGGEMFKIVAGVSVAHIPYKGSVPALLDLIGGRVQVVFADMPVALPHVKAGKLRALAVAGPKPFPLTSGIPTAIEAGLLGFVLDNWWGLLTMKGVPAAIINKVNAELVKALAQPDVIERYTAMGVESVTSTPRGFSDIIRRDEKIFSKVVKDAGITVE